VIHNLAADRSPPHLVWLIDEVGPNVEEEFAYGPVRIDSRSVRARTRFAFGCKQVANSLHQIVADDVPALITLLVLPFHCEQLFDRINLLLRIDDLVVLAAHSNQVDVRVTLGVRLILVIPRSARPLALDVAHLTDDCGALDKGLATVGMGAQIVRHSEDALDRGIGRACQTPLLLLSRAVATAVCRRWKSI
jgi:hypothetical protein